jgi:hypothetical protein
MDFLGRLVARSLGEKPAVRPRIAASFVPAHELGWRAPAGEILTTAQEEVPVIAPIRSGPERISQQSQRLPPREASTDWPATSPRARRSSHVNFAPSGEQLETEREAEDTDSQPFTVPQQIGVPQPQAFADRDSETPRSTFNTPTPGPREGVVSVQAAADIREPVESSKQALTPVSSPMSFPVIPAMRAAVRAQEPVGKYSKKQKSSEPPAIQVTIGRIEVRASTAAPRASEKKAPTGAMSLEEYQRRRSRRNAG